MGCQHPTVGKPPRSAEGLHRGASNCVFIAINTHCGMAAGDRGWNWTSKGEAEMSETTETIEPAALMDLYRRIAARQAARTPTLREMRERSPEEHAAYMREANKRSRAKAREAKANGSPEPTKAMVRDALADAALILLASGGPGAEEVRKMLHRAFPGRAGLPGQIASEARSGKRKPKLLTPERLASGI